MQAGVVATLPPPTLAALPGPIQTLACLLLARVGEPHRIATKQLGSCQQHLVRVLHRVASGEGSSTRLPAAVFPRASNDSSEQLGTRKISLSRPSSARAGADRQSTSGQQPITCKSAGIPASTA